MFSSELKTKMRSVSRVFSFIQWAISWVFGSKNLSVLCQLRIIFLYPRMAVLRRNKTKRNDEKIFKKPCFFLKAKIAGGARRLKKATAGWRWKTPQRGKQNINERSVNTRVRVIIFLEWGGVFLMFRVAKNIRRTNGGKYKDSCFREG